MNYLYVKYNHYINFINENKSDRLNRNLKLMISSTKSGKILKEIFEYPLETTYKIEEYSPNILVSFNSNSNNKYRLDIIKIFENDEFINHIAFSDYENKLEDSDDYERLLDRNEFREILNRIHYIMIDLIDNGFINNKFCIGGTKLEKKNRIYQFFLKVVVGDSGIKKLKTDLYDTGWGLYFNV
jgi:hypothetical protein